MKNAKNYFLKIKLLYLILTFSTFNGYSCNHKDSFTLPETVNDTIKTYTNPIGGISPSGNRNVCIDRLYFENDEMKIIGPTLTSQPLPGGSSPRIVQTYKN